VAGRIRKDDITPWWAQGSGTYVHSAGAFSRRSPFAHWYEDVRALGFLRPPWGLASDNLFALSFT